MEEKDKKQVRMSVFTSLISGKFERSEILIEK
jgi:hypothetical protein